MSGMLRDLAFLAPFLVNFGGVFSRGNDSRFLYRARRKRAVISHARSFLRADAFYLRDYQMLSFVF